MNGSSIFQSARFHWKHFWKEISAKSRKIRYCYFSEVYFCFPDQNIGSGNYKKLNHMKLLFEKYTGITKPLTIILRRQSRVSLLSSECWQYHDCKQYYYCDPERCLFIIMYMNTRGKGSWFCLVYSCLFLIIPVYLGFILLVFLVFISLFLLRQPSRLI